MITIRIPDRVRTTTELAWMDGAARQGGILLSWEGDRELAVEWAQGLLQEDIERLLQLFVADVKALHAVFPREDEWAGAVRDSCFDLWWWGLNACFHDLEGVWAVLLYNEERVNVDEAEKLWKAYKVDWWMADAVAAKLLSV